MNEIFEFDNTKKFAVKLQKDFNRTSIIESIKGIISSKYDEIEQLKDEINTIEENISELNYLISMYERGDHFF